MSRIYILLPVHNRRAITARFIECLQRQSHKGYQLVLIDDGSTDGTARMVGEAIPDAVLLQGDGSLWWAGSLQLGYRWLAKAGVHSGDLVLIINDDTYFDEEFLATGLGLLAGRDRVMLHAQCRDQRSGVLLDDGVSVDWKELSFSQVHCSEKISCLSTRGLFMRVSDFLETGGFRPRLLPHYLSDYEFTMRALKLGMAPIIDPSLKVWTYQGDSEKMPAQGLIDALQRIFSRNSPADPFAWFMFVLLRSPWAWKPLNLTRVCVRTLVKVIKQYQLG